MTLFGTGAVFPRGSVTGAVAVSAVRLDQQSNKFEVLDWVSSPLTIWYAGMAPGIINGVFQINVQLPPNLPTSGFTPKLTLRGFGGTVVSNAVQVFLK